MWIRRRRWDALQARVQELERIEAIYRQQVAWLAESNNRIETERALLFQRLVGVNLPVATVEPQPAQPPVGVAGRPLTDADEPVQGIDVGALMIGAAAFEDMGDEEAERHRIPSSVVAALR